MREFENLKMGQAATLSDPILSYSKSKKIFLKIKKSKALADSLSRENQFPC